MQLIKVSELNPHPQNNYFFDDITGDKWKDILESISRRGVIEPIVITQDKIIVSGHQRVRACKELNIDEVLCEIRIYQDDDKHSKEDKILEDLISTNIMQRGIGNTNPLKLARCIQELERIKGVSRGGDRNPNGNNQYGVKTTKCRFDQNPQITQEDIAKQFGVSVKKLQRVKSLLELPEDIQRLIETGVLDNISLAKRISEELTPEEMEDFTQFLVVQGCIKVTSKIFNSYRKEIEESNQEILNTKEKQLRSQEGQITQLKQDIKDSQAKMNKAIREGKQAIVDKLQPQLDKLNKELKDKEEEIKSLNKYSLTKEEIDLANIKYEQSSQAITTAVEVEYNVQKIIGELSKLKISDLYPNEEEIVYRNKVLNILYLARNEINRMINELKFEDETKIYESSDIIEEVEYHD